MNSQNRTTPEPRRPVLGQILTGLSLLALSASLLGAPFLRSDKITTVAGSGEASLGKRSGPALKVNIGQPFGVEVGPAGGIYVTEVSNHRVLRLDPKSDSVETVVGNGQKGHSGDGGKATEASLNEPYEVRFDADGNMYVVEMVGAVIRKIDPAGTITTLAGTGEKGFSGDDGPALKAQFSQPHSIALDGKGGLYVADIGNHRIRRIDLESGFVTTFAGTGEKKLPRDGVVATGEPMLGPRALHIQGDTLWIALREGHSIWKMDLQTRTLRHVAGMGEKGFADGQASRARFNGPKGIVAGRHNDVFVVDTENQAIRRIDLERAIVQTVAGAGPETRGFGGDGGLAIRGLMDRPHGITIDTAGSLYIGDTNNHRVRKVTFVVPK
jgi:streptogramin lyase